MLETDAILRIFEHLGLAGIMLYLFIRERASHDKTRKKLEDCLADEEKPGSSREPPWD